MSPVDAPPRLFAGVSVPPEVGQAIGVVTAAGTRLLPDARWSPPEDWHVTLMFLGDVALARVVEISVRLRRIAERTSGFETAIGGMGGFPSAARARVVWIGLDDPDDGWSGLASGVREALAGVVLPAPQAFVPHITLARSAQPIALPRSLVERVVGPVGFAVTGFSLFRSHPDSSGARYEILERYPFDPLR
jgi:RNA 2',3'-cyclic 3'-phosphodiesterase